MKITHLLDRPIAYHRIFVTLTGSVKAAVMLSQAVYWQARAKQSDGWWYKTAEEWREETGLSEHEQRSARKAAEKYLLSDLRGIPATLYYRVNEEVLYDDIIQTSSAVSPELVGEEVRNINKNTETTSETNHEPSLVDASLASLKPKNWQKLTEKTMLDRRELLKTAEKIEAELGLKPDLKDNKWKRAVRAIMEFEKNGQPLSKFAEWLKSGNDYNRPKTFQMAKDPTLIISNWPQAFQNGKSDFSPVQTDDNDSPMSW